MDSLKESAEGLGHFKGDFLSTLKEEKDSKALWRDLYFYVIGDPMKDKANRVRRYIKTELKRKATLNQEMTKHKKMNIRSVRYKKSSKKVVRKPSSKRKPRLDPHKDSKIGLPNIEEEIQMLNQSLNNSPFKDEFKKRNFKSLETKSCFKKLPFIQLSATLDQDKPRQVSPVKYRPTKLSASKLLAKNKNSLNKISVFFQNRINSPTNLKNGEFAIIKCPSAKRSPKLQKLRLKEKGLNIFKNIQKSPLSIHRYRGAAPNVERNVKVDKEILYKNM
ncbi:unnamed protein product [Moneuplotes crassus]|uniref:Uncharacterized protein n=1 Tax=Euplotes crassus TaxID=5936 RepID=A0AAD1XN84_EUPCR|nr:unnamed protein product [Moneuplotes crassus]